MNRPSFLARFWKVMITPRGDRMWDAFLRSTAGLGIAGIILVLLVPASAPLTGFAIYTLWVAGPLSPLFPVGLEPPVILLGRLYDPLLVAVVVTAAGLWVEFLNYHLYRIILGMRSLKDLSEGRWTKALQRLFDRAPFLSVWIGAWSPLPFWVIRIPAALGGYSMPRYLLAIALGRLPKFWLFAVVGRYWHVPAHILFAIVVGGTLVAVGLWFLRKSPRRRSTPGSALTDSSPECSAAEDPETRA